MKPVYASLQSTSPRTGLSSVLASLVIGIWTLAPVARAGVTFTTNTVIDTSNLAYEGQDIVVQGCTLTVNGTHGFNSVSLLTGAVLTHQATTSTQEYSLTLTLANNLTVDGTSKVDVSGRGYQPGYTLGNTGVGAANYTAGGSYGGFGQVCCSGSSVANAVYGDYHNPNELGSGSGTYAVGSPGGGLVRIATGTAQVDGGILANGGTGPYEGGSGGGIWLSVGTLSGSGQIAANGGNGSSYDGGGGGRVAIYYSSSTFNLSSNVNANAGNGPQGPGSVGTVYLKQTGGPGQLVISSHGTPAAIWTPLGAETDAAFQVDMLLVSGTNVVAAPAHQMAMDVGAVSIANAAVLTQQPTTAAQEYSLLLTVTNNLVVDAASRIDVSGRGYLPGYTLGNTNLGAAIYTAGGSYGGFGQICCGGGSAPNAVYGDYHNPNELGSGSGTYAVGSPGGGLVRIATGTAQVDGGILANGGTGPYEGGSGGGIWLSVGTLSGSGQIAANGGNGSSYDGGGGGRVALYYTSSTFDLSNNVTANAGDGPSGPGSVGTVYLKPAGGLGQLVINSHGTPTGVWTPLGAGTDSVFQVDMLLVSGTNVVAAPEHQMAMEVGTVSILDGAVLTHQPTTPVQEYSLLLTVASNLLVDGASRIDISGRGYLPGYTLGNTTKGAAYYTAGGSYGGSGGLCCGSTENAVYGDYHNPNELGSGSGTYGDGGAPGGGLARITAGEAQVDGAILADGGNGSDQGGSGGGIWLSVGTLSGSGEIAANGGAGISYDGGGGGRVAIYYGSSSFSLSSNVTAKAGDGHSAAGSVGTVYLKQTGSLGQLVISSHGTTPGQWTPLGQTNDLVFTAEALVISGTGTVAATVSGAPIQAASLSLINGAVLTHPETTASQEYSLVLTVTNELLVDAASRIDVSARGYLPGYTFGNTTIGAAYYTAGGSYGGSGGLCCGSTGNAVYGDYHNPNELGSGSGTYGNGGAPGGGLVRITAATAQVDGAILANGGNGSDQGGSGGGVLVNAGTLSGSGQITANGGASSGYDGGGGGRVAIYYSSNTFNLSSNVTANAGGGPHGPGSVGTVYLQPAGGLGQLVLSSHGTAAGQWTPLGVGTDAVFQVDMLLVSGSNVVAAPEHQMAVDAEAVSIIDGAVLTHQVTTPAQEYSLLLTVTSNLLVDGASRIDVSGRGYLSGYTLGNTTVGAASYTAGGSYGGLGGLCCNGGADNALYGSYANPNELGSGSGTYGGGGAPGGGLVRITAGAAQVDGAILANGGNGSDQGGSGGGVLVNAGALSGSGQITANGGAGGSYDGGGGGRVAIYTWTATGMQMPATNLLASGGHGPDANGGTGTVYLASEPFFMFVDVPQYWHGVQQVSWQAIGIDPARGDTANLVVAGNGVTYFKQGVPATGSTSWDSTTVTSGNYTMTLDFFDRSGDAIGLLSQNILINNSVIWHEGTLTANQTWASGTVHVVDASIVVPSGVTLTISPGAIVKFTKGTSIAVQTGGILNALGTSTQPIILTSFADDSAGGDSNLDGSRSQPEPGDWSGVAVVGGQFNYSAFVDIRYSENTVGGTIASSQSWLGTGVYLVSNSVVIPSGVTLTINPGAVVKFAAGAGMTVQSGGTLNALGTVVQPIAFTSINDDSVGGVSNRGSSANPAAGDWVSFNISGKALLGHCSILYGGNTGSGAFASGVIIVNGGSLALSNSVVSTALYDGLSVYGSTGSGLVVNTVLRNLDRAVWAWNAGNVRLVNCTFDQDLVGLDNHGGGVIDAENCIIANYINASAIEGAVTVRYTDLWSSYANANNPITIGQNGNISADPRFINEPQGDYRLNYLSPCINAADGTQAPATDFQGDPPYNDPRTLVKKGVPNAGGIYPDMGAFEFVEEAPSAVDLIADSILGPSEAQAGQTVTVQWTDMNLGTQPAVGPWHDSVSLVSMSDTNIVLSADVILTGQGVVLGPGQGYTNSATFPVPGGTAGNYRWQVQVNSQGDIYEGANWTNSFGLAVSPTTLTVPLLSLNGAALTNQFAAANGSFYFSFLPQPNQDIQVSLNVLSGFLKGTGGVNVYIGQGYMPTPQHFDFSETGSSSPNLSALVPSASTQPYYILVVPAVPGGTAPQFTIAASPLTFQVTGVSPGSVGNGGPSTLQIQGSQLTAAMAYQVVDPSGTPHSPISLSAVNNSEVSATFDFTGLPAGTYAVRIAGTSAALPGALQVTKTPPGSLAVQITGPQYQRAGRVSTLLVDYRNTGGSDLTAPILFLQANNGQFRLPGQTTWRPGLFHVLAINQQGPAGVLPAGYHGVIQIEFSQQTAGAGVSTYTVSVADPSAAVDWAGLYTTLQPPLQPADSWGVIYTNFLSKAGSTYGQFQSVLAQDATYLGLAGEQVMDVRQLLSFEFQQADNFGTITKRYRLGAFGRGLNDPTDVSALGDGSGNVAVRAFNQVRRFALQSDGSYLSQRGDFGTLTQTGGDFQLREKNGEVTSFGPDGKLDYTQDANGNRTTANYTGGRLTSFSDSFGNTTTLAYNSSGRVTQVTDPVGRATTYGYDAGGQHVIGITNSAGGTALNWISGQGAATEHALASITHPDGTHIYYQYDANGRATNQFLDGGAQPISYAYDPMGGVTATDASGSSVTVHPNDFFKVAKFQDALGIVTRASYDGSQDLTALQNTAGQAIASEYDSNGNLISLVDPLGHETDSTYDAAFSGPNSVADSLGHLVTVQYDAKGNMVSETYPGGSLNGYQPDSRGNIVAWTNRRGRTTRYGYDSHNLLTNRTLADGTLQTFVYDPHRNLTSMTDATGTTTFAYDAADRLSQVSYPGGRLLQFTYDAGGRRTKLADQGGFVENYSYDANGRLAAISDNNSNTIAAYTYDKVGRVIRKDLGNGASVNYAFTPSGQVQSIVNRGGGGTVLSSVGYTYDALGRVAGMTNSAGTSTYGYDANNRLISVNLPGGRAIAYQYDPNGNRAAVVDSGTNRTYTGNALNQYLTAGTGAYSYDADGNLVSKTDPTGTTTFTYDDQNELVGISSPAGTWTYEYNALGQRVAMTQNGQRTSYVLDPFGLGSIIGEYRAGGAVTAHYAYGLDLASRVDAGGSPAYYTFDASGNTVGLMDQGGNLTDTCSYLPFGEKLAATGATVNPFTFGGRFGVLDDGNGAYCMRARFYAPDLGRFLSTDPGQILAPNLYAYGNNNPPAFVDPSGRQPSGPQTEVNAVNNLNNALNFGQNANNAVNNSLNGPGTPSDTTSTAVGAFGEAATAGGSNVATAGGVASTAVGGVQAVATGGVLAIANQNTQNAIFNLPELGGNGGKPPSGGPADGGPGSPPGGGPPGSSGSTTDLNSSDPNDKTGVGFGAQGFVTADGGLFYEIHFANQTNATAPAQEVVVSDQLDPNLDWTSLQLQSIAFNDVTITVPPGLQSYSNMVQVSTDPNPVQVRASLNRSTGLVTWDIKSIDRANGKLVEDPLAGFLPPDNAQGAGEGFVTYTVQPMAGLASGTVIHNRASIVFDVNAPILTPTLTNTVDAASPTSAMSPLPPASPPTFTVSWSGTDPWSGIASFNIYASTNGGPWGLWLTGTTNTSATFTGVLGNSYAFYSVAIDHVGNIETAPTIPGAHTTVGNVQPGPLLSHAEVSNGEFQFTLNLTSTNSFVIQASTDLKTWISLQTNQAPFTFVDTNSARSGRRFYRTQTLP